MANSAFNPTAFRQGPAASAPTVKVTITQSNTFATNDVLKYSGGTYAKAQADSVANAQVVGVVESATANDFVLVTGGQITMTGLSAGSIHYLDASTAGALTTTEPTISVPVVYGVSSTLGYVIRTEPQPKYTDQVTLTGTQTLTNKTLTSPTINTPTITQPNIADFSSAVHDHQDNDDGGTLAEAALALTDVTTNDASTTKHGFCPKFPNNTTNFLRADGTFAAPVFSKSYVSSGQTITSGGSLTLAHGLGTMPTLIQTRIKCTSAEGNYSVNDEVIVSFHEVEGASTSRGVSVSPDSTNLNIRFGDGGTNVFNIANKTTGALFICDNTKWQLIVYAWA